MKKIFSLLMICLTFTFIALFGVTNVSVNASNGDSTEENYVEPAYGEDEPIIGGEEGISDKDEYELNNSFKQATNITNYGTSQPLDSTSSINATLHDVTWFWGVWRYVDEDYYRLDLFGDAYLTITLDVPNDVNYDIELFYHTDTEHSLFGKEDIITIGKDDNGGVGITETISITDTNVISAGTYYIRVSSHNEDYASGDEYTLSYNIDYRNVSNEYIDQMRFNKGSKAAIWKSDFDPYGFETFKFEGELPRTNSRNPFHGVMEDYSTNTGVVNAVLYIWDTEWRNDMAEYFDAILEVYNQVNDKNQKVQVTVEIFEDATGAIGTVVNIVGQATGYPIVEIIGDGISTGGEVIASLIKLLFPEIWETTLQEAIDYFEALSDALKCAENIDSTEVIAIKCKYQYETDVISFMPTLDNNENFVYSSNTINAYNSESHTYGKIYLLNSFTDYEYFIENGYINGKNDINTCPPIDIELNEVKQGNLISGKYYWYKFTAPVSGEYKFYTEGSTDTYGELFSVVVAARSTENRLSNGYNDDAGDGNNFLLEYDLEANQTVYLRVRGWNWIRTGSFNITVETTEHIHEYTYSYETSTTLKHKAYCSCGEYINEQHNYVNNVCTECGQTYSHTHSYTYQSHGNGRTHSKMCSCGISTTESCIGLAEVGAATRCVKCNQVMSSGSIIMGNNDNDENISPNMIVPYLEEDSIIPYLDENEVLVE